MSRLSAYEEKRDSARTPEPGMAGTTQRSQRSIFVVQRHKASRLHYDLRLELDGVLKSWAVPKGPSLDPKDKRLAMMVEDHPYAYKDFKGVIPEGSYGAGIVEIWDKGTYEPINAEGKKIPEEQFLKDLASGSIKFKLKGRKLKGEFALVRMKSDKAENAWLMIKHRDAAAVSGYDSEAHVAASSPINKALKAAGKKASDPKKKAPRKRPKS